LQDGVQLLQHSLGVGSRLRVSKPYALAQVGNFRIDEAGDRAPPSECLGPELRCANRLQLRQDRQVELPTILLAQRPQLRVTDPVLPRCLERLPEDAVGHLFGATTQSARVEAPQGAQPPVLSTLPGADCG